MNRIKEIRKAAGLTQEQLAERAGTTANHIWRLEAGRTELTQTWMDRLAEALACTAADIIANAVAAEIEEEVESVEPTAVTAAIAKRGLHIYRVKARSVINAGVKPGDVVTVDQSEEGVESLKGLEIVLVEIGPDRTKVLRQYVPPGLLLTNRSGANLTIAVNDPSVDPIILGVVIPPGNGN